MVILPPSCLNSNGSAPIAVTAETCAFKPERIYLFPGQYSNVQKRLLPAHVNRQELSQSPLSPGWGIMGLKGIGSISVMASLPPLRSHCPTLRTMSLLASGMEPSPEDRC